MDLKKAQVTLELLLVFLIGLSVLFISMSAITRLQGAQGIIFEKKILQDEANEISRYADEICILGEGNSRMVPLAKNVFTIVEGSGGYDIILQSSKNSAYAKTICKISIKPDSKFSTFAYLWHETDSNNEPYVMVSPEPKT
jgi:hypothetical protein